MSKFTTIFNNTINSFFRNMFSLKGRISYREFRFYFILISVLWNPIMVGLILPIVAANFKPSSYLLTARVEDIVYLVFVGFIFWPWFAIIVKRAHDRNLHATKPFILFASSILVNSIAVEIFSSELSKILHPLFLFWSIVILSLLAFFSLFWCIYIIFCIFTKGGSEGANQFGPAPKHTD